MVGRALLGSLPVLQIEVTGDFIAQQRPYRKIPKKSLANLCDHSRSYLNASICYKKKTI